MGICAPSPSTIFGRNRSWGVAFHPKGLAMSREQENVYARTTRAGSASGLASQLEDACVQPLVMVRWPSIHSFNRKPHMGFLFYIHDRKLNLILVPTASTR